MQLLSNSSRRIITSSGAGLASQVDQLAPAFVTVAQDNLLIARLGPG